MFMSAKQNIVEITVSPLALIFSLHQKLSLTTIRFIDKIPQVAN